MVCLVWGLTLFYVTCMLPLARCMKWREELLQWLLCWSLCLHHSQHSSRKEGVSPDYTSFILPQTHVFLACLYKSAGRAIALLLALALQCSSQAVPLRHSRIFSFFGAEKISSCAIRRRKFITVLAANALWSGAFTCGNTINRHRNYVKMQGKF